MAGSAVARGCEEEKNVTSAKIDCSIFMSEGNIDAGITASASRAINMDAPLSEKLPLGCTTPPTPEADVCVFALNRSSFACWDILYSGGTMWQHRALRCVLTVKHLSPPFQRRRGRRSPEGRTAGPRRSGRRRSTSSHR